jgi:chromosome partitioning protein
MLPAVLEAPQMLDVEFEESELDVQPPEKYFSSAKPRRVLVLPEPLQTPAGRARVVTVMNQKGGVAKTTTVINVAAQIASKGHKVLIVDCDPQGNCATGLGIDKGRVNHGTRTLMLEPEKAVSCRHATGIPGLHIVVADRSLVGLEQELISQLGREKRLTEGLESLLPFYDIVLLDTPPSLGLVTMNALVASDAILIPVQTEYFALEGLALLASTIREVRKRLNPDLGVDAVVLTMHAPTLLNGQVAAQLRETFPEFIVDPPIRRNIRLAEAPSHGIPIHLHAPDSMGGLDYAQLADNLIEKWGLTASAEGN